MAWLWDWVNARWDKASSPELAPFVCVGEKREAVAVAVAVAVHDQMEPIREMQGQAKVSCVCVYR